MSDKKSRELSKIERFIPAMFPEKPNAIAQPEPPLPDVIIDVSGRKVGIEITDLVLNEHAMLQESEQEHVLKEAQRLYEHQYQLPLHVTVTFAESADWKKVNRQKVGAFLAETVMQCVLYSSRSGLRVEDMKFAGE